MGHVIWLKWGWEGVVGTAGYVCVGAGAGAELLGPAGPRPRGGQEAELVGQADLGEEDPDVRRCVCLCCLKLQKEHRKEQLI